VSCPHQLASSVGPPVVRTEECAALLSRSASVLPLGLETTANIQPLVTSANLLTLDVPTMDGATSPLDIASVRMDTMECTAKCHRQLERSALQLCARMVEFAVK